MVGINYNWLASGGQNADSFMRLRLFYAAFDSDAGSNNNTAALDFDVAFAADNKRLAAMNNATQFKLFADRVVDAELFKLMPTQALSRPEVDVSKGNGCQSGVVDSASPATQVENRL